MRRHDWLEVLVVVIGVFTGVQASNWNDERGEARRAGVFSDRLRGDLREEAWAYEMLIGSYGEVAAYRATQYNSNIRRRATYDELTSTGEIGLIRGPALRDLAMRK
ncbi:MAG: hypothetical protein H7147_00615 [Frankiaceae bacterium]|nr:hypothetical protein [Arenimonas sp.]